MKLKHDLINTYVKNMKTCEVDLYLYLCRRSNGAGQVQGVYYQDVRKACDMCAASFYNAKRGLEKMGAITCVEKEGDWDITITGNDFTDGNYRNYINLNREIFHQKRFKKLSGKEKYMLLEMLKNCQRSEDYGCCKRNCSKLYENYSKLLGVTKRTVRSYLHKLKSFFSIGIKKGNYYIEYRKKVFAERHQSNVVAEIEWHINQLVTAVCRRQKKTLSGNARKDLIGLYKMCQDKLHKYYGTKHSNAIIEKMTDGVLIHAMLESFDKAADDEPNLPFINKLCMEKLLERTTA